MKTRTQQYTEAIERAHNALDDNDLDLASTCTDIAYHVKHDLGMQAIYHTKAEVIRNG